MAELPTPEDVLATPTAQTSLAAVVARARTELLAGQPLTAPTSAAVRQGLIAALRRARWRVLDPSAGRWQVEALPRAPGACGGPGMGKALETLVPLRLDVAREANLSKAYRRVLYTSTELQVTAMALEAGATIGEEAHPHADQVILIASGRGEVRLDGRAWTVQTGELVLVPAGVRHDLLAGPQGLRLLAVYAPPLHIDGRVHETRADAEADSADAAYGAEQQAGLWLPARYGVGVAVPGDGEGGARCSTCRFGSVGDLPLEPETGVCYNRLYQRVETQGLLVPGPHGGRTLPASADAWCCPFWVGAGADGAVAGDDTRSG